MILIYKLNLAAAPWQINLFQCWNTMVSHSSLTFPPTNMPASHRPWAGDHLSTTWQLLTLLFLNIFLTNEIQLLVCTQYHIHWLHLSGSSADAVSLYNLAHLQLLSSLWPISVHSPNLKDIYHFVSLLPYLQCQLLDLSKQFNVFFRQVLVAR